MWPQYRRENFMPTRNVNLTATLDTFVKKQVRLGHFNNGSEVHRSALAAMARQEEERVLQLESLRREIQLGIDDVKAGRSAKISSLTVGRRGEPENRKDDAGGLAATGPRLG
jgi:antitoxin ParD1/3/4